MQSIIRYFLVAMAVTVGVLIPVAIATGLYFSWRHSEEEKSRTAKEELRIKKNRAEFTEDIRRIESNARAGYHPKYGDDPSDTSLLGVIRWKYGQAYDDVNDEDLIESTRRTLYPTIPKDLFDKWARDPYGQEKIDSSLRDHDQDK